MDERFGFIHEKFDIKLLILFILRRLPAPVSLDDLAGLALCDDGISYFEFAECLASLVESRHVLCQEDGNYSVTEKGSRNGETLEGNLPYSVRIRAERSASMMALIQKRNQLIDASHTVRSRGGCTVNLSLSDGVGSLMKMELLAGSEQQAAAMERRFKERAEDIYSKITELLSRED